MSTTRQLRCAGCGQDCPASAFSGKQLKLKGRRLCAACATQRPAAPAAAREAPAHDPVADRARCLALLAAVEAAGGTCAAVRVSTVPGLARERGLTLAVDVPAGAEVLVLPARLLITAATARDSPEGLALTAAGWRPSTDHAWLALAVLMAERAGAESPHAAYVAALPRDLRHLPSGFTKAQRRALRGSPLLATLEERERACLVEHAGLAALCGAAEFQWARAVATSRAFAFPTPAGPVAALVPLADLMNHSDAPTVSWRFDAARSAFVCAATGPLTRGAALTDSYGAKSSARNLLNYGFVPAEAVDVAAVFLPLHALDPEAPPALAAARRRLLGPPRSFDDGYALYARTVAGKRETRVRLDGLSRFELGTQDPCALPACLSALRVAVADAGELRGACAHLEAELARRVAAGEERGALVSSLVAQVGVPPLSERNERAALHALGAAAEQALAAYAPGPDPPGPLGRLLAGERGVLRWARDLAAAAARAPAGGRGLERALKGSSDPATAAFAAATYARAAPVG